jgi:hypothetical protein
MPESLGSELDTLILAKQVLMFTVQYYHSSTSIGVIWTTSKGALATPRATPPRPESPLLTLQSEGTQFFL